MPATASALRTLVVPALAIAVGACAALAGAPEGSVDFDAPSNVAASWEHAQVFVPGSPLAQTPDAVATAKAFPVVLYMHGCAGITADHDLRWAHFLQQLGYIVVLPDSFARPGRKSDCDPARKTGGFFPRSHGMRLQEIHYAMGQIKDSPWVDQRNVFLMGHSEGGLAAVLSYPEGFRGIILSGTYVYAETPESDIVLASADTPILSLVWRYDLWSGALLRPDANTFSRHVDSKMLVFAGAGHETFAPPAARQAVEEFLKHNTAH